MENKHVTAMACQNCVKSDAEAAHCQGQWAVGKCVGSLCETSLVQRFSQAPRSMELLQVLQASGSRGHGDADPGQKLRSVTMSRAETPTNV